MRLIHIIASSSMGGRERYALDICSHFADGGHEVIAVTRDAKAVDEQFASRGITLRHAPLRDYPDFFSSIILRNIINENPDEPTVIHVHRYRDALTAITARHWAKRHDIRIIATRHKAAPGKNNWLRRLIYRNLDANIFVSDFSKRTFLSSWPDERLPFDSRRIFVALNSRQSQPERVPEPTRGAITALYHGLIKTGKGIETIIRALDIIKRQKRVRLRLRIAGSGETDYIDSIRHLALRHDVLDLIDWSRNIEDPATLVSKSHFGVLPADTPEAFGMSNIEYMMAGRPQITTFNGAQSEYLTPGIEALEVPPGDPEALADAMTRLASDPSLRQSLGEAAAHRYDTLLAWPEYISKISAIYNPEILTNAF
ncbi:MAG: glycosyltransferase family 4 protein [Muribaculaceae bacterium]|nr:glycosyltransferase family 4 protein [Muribaculaceae bacterium]